MKKTSISALGLVLSACAKEPTVSDTLTENAVNATTGLEQSLPTECKTDAILTQITVVKTEIRAISKACQAEKDVITRDKLKWKLAFWALTGVVIAYVLRKILK
jgi:hypothetical protein